jgi:Flp pilus assembly pilin Flp
MDFRARFFSFLKDENGQATVEYILLLSITVVGAASFARVIMSSLDRAVLRLGGQLEKDLKSGRAPLSVWEN